jgi:undecaprenyl-diphosphatase
MKRLSTAWADLLRWLGKPLGVLLMISAIGLGLATLLGWGFAELYESVVAGTGVAGFDKPVLEVMVAHRTAASAAAVTWFTQTAGPIGMPILGTVASVLIALRARRITPVILALVAGAGSLAMTIAVKGLVGRDRPPLAEAVPPFESSSSFPSGHSLNAVVIIGIVTYSLVLTQRSRWAKVLTLVVGSAYAVAVGLSRVYLGHHWLSDVVGAWLLGLAWLLVVIVAHRVARTYAARKKPSLPPH